MVPPRDSLPSAVWLLLITAVATVPGAIGRVGAIDLVPLCDSLAVSGANRGLQVPRGGAARLRSLAPGEGLVPTARLEATAPGVRTGAGAAEDLPSGPWRPHRPNLTPWACRWPGPC